MAYILIALGVVVMIAVVSAIIIFTRPKGEL